MSAMDEARVCGVRVRARKWLVAAVSVTGLVAAAPAAFADTGCTSSGVSNVTVTCPVGVSDSWTVPAHVTQATFDVQGAAGGDSGNFDPQRGGSSGPGGSGDDVQATVPVTPGQAYTIEVGARGVDGNSNALGTPGQGDGGAPGGGQGSFTCGQPGICAAAGGGGGASLISLGDPSNPANWLVVAGGGGGGGPSLDADGGAGGYPQGAHAANVGQPDPCTGGAGGSGSSAHLQGSGGANGTSAPGGGGGGGFVGGSGGQQGCGGGGGSSFITSNALPGSAVEGTPRSSGDGSVTITYVLPLAPSASVASPGDGATYAVGQAVSSRFTCADGINGPGISSCTDSQGRASGAQLDTTTAGTHQFAVTATSSDGQQSTSTVTYTVLAPAAAGPPPTGTIAPPAGSAPPRAVVSASGVSLALTRPVACTISGGKLIVTVATTHSGPGFRLLRYSFFVDRGRAHKVRRRINGRRRLVTVFAPNAVSSRAGAHGFSVKGLKAGSHTITVVALVRSRVLSDASGRARTTSLTAKLPFTVC